MSNLRLRVARCLLLLLFLVAVSCSTASKDGEQNTGSNSDHETDVPVPAEYTAGLEIYTEKCALCHDHGEAGSPRLGNPKQWAKRVPQGEEVLTKHAVEGFEGKWGEMPPQGDDLTQEEVGSAVRYMIYRYEQAEQ